MPAVYAMDDMWRMTFGNGNNGGESRFRSRGARLNESPNSGFRDFIGKCLAHVKRRPLPWICLAAAPVFLLGLAAPGLNDGEAMYAQIAREMRMGGDWITPHLNGTRHFDKPPLLYWMIALSQTAMGESEFIVRFWPALAAWATVPVIGAIGAALFTRRAGWIASLVFATSLGPFLFGRMVMPDPSMCFWISLAILGYVKGFVRGDGRGGPWPWVMFAGAGLASLIKGALGLGLPVAIIGVHAMLSGKWRSLYSRRLALGIGITAAIVLPWFVAVSRRNPGFLSYFFIREHLMRFTGQRFPPDEFLSLPAFLIMTFMLVFPWAFMAPQAILHGVRRLSVKTWRSGPDLLPIIWIALVIGLFSASRSRLEYYGFTAIPAIALMIGRLWDELFEGARNNAPSRGALAALGFLAAISAVASIAVFVVLGPAKDIVFRTIAANWPESGWTAGPEQTAVLERIRWAAMATPSGIAFLSAAAFVSIRKSLPGLACSILAAMMVPVFAMVYWGFLVMEPFMSSRAFGEAVRLHARPGDAVVCREPHEYMYVGGIAFYSARMVYILKDPLFEGIPEKRREPPDRFLDLDGFLELWKSPRRVLLVADRADPMLEEPALGARGETILETGGRVMIGNGVK